MTAYYLTRVIDAYEGKPLYTLAGYQNNKVHGHFLALLLFCLSVPRLFVCHSLSFDVFHTLIWLSIYLSNSLSSIYRFQSFIYIYQSISIGIRASRLKPASHPTPSSCSVAPLTDSSTSTRRRMAQGIKTCWSTAQGGICTRRQGQDWRTIGSVHFVKAKNYSR